MSAVVFYYRRSEFTTESKFTICSVFSMGGSFGQGGGFRNFFVSPGFPKNLLSFFFVAFYLWKEKTQ